MSKVKVAQLRIMSRTSPVKCAAAAGVDCTSIGLHMFLRVVIGSFLKANHDLTRDDC